MKIDGVTDGKPASKAGIMKDDLLIKMDTMEINSMKDYMKALGNFKKGQTIKVSVKRGEEIKTMDLTF